LEVTRTVDLTEQGSNLVIFNNEIAFERSKDENDYYFAVAKDYEKNIVALQAVTIKGDNSKPFYLKSERVENLPAGFFGKQKNLTKLEDNLILFKINLLPADTSVQSERMIVMEYHKGRREPYPKVIRVYEKQKCEVFDSKYFLSVYPTEKSTVTLNTERDNVHFKSHEPSSTGDFSITYGPFSDISPLTFEQIQLMYTYAFPLPYFKKATRDIFVSHWGSIAIDEYFDIFNEAAGINGQFSRVDYMPHINPNHGQNAINSLGTILPQYIHGLYYYDYIGNISSSHAERKEDHVFFNIEPRFPIFG